TAGYGWAWVIGRASPDLLRAGSARISPELAIGRPEEGRGAFRSTIMSETARIDRSRLHAALAAEERRFIDEHPRSRDLFEKAKASLFEGVPMNWMVRWAGAFPVFVAEASGARFRDVDGRE